MPYVRGSTKVPPITVDLTREGSRDWAHWGLTSDNDYDHKAAVTSQLLDFLPLGTATPRFKKGGPTMFQWSDGTPVPSATTSNGVSWVGLDQGFKLVIPASYEERVVNLYVGAMAGTIEINATSSDTSASLLQDHIDGPIGSWNLRMLTVEHGFAAAGSKITIALLVSDALDATAAVSLNAVTFSGP